MRSDSRRTEAEKQYAAAHTAQYVTKDLLKALELHRGVMTTHPDTQEAEYARTQIGNIVKSVVPERVLLGEQIALAAAYLEEEGPADLEPAQGHATRAGFAQLAQPRDQDSKPDG